MKSIDNPSFNCRRWLELILDNENTEIDEWYTRVKLYCPTLCDYEELRLRRKNVRLIQEGEHVENPWIR